MFNAVDILKQKILNLIKVDYFKLPRQEYINNANHALSNLIHHMYDDHGIISTI